MNGAQLPTALSDSSEPARHAGKHHARYLEPDVPVHIISRVFQGRHLLRPCKVLNSIILGVIGRAQTLYDSVDLFAYAFLANHMHLMAMGPPEQLAAFVAYIKREISRRWARTSGVGWSEAMWTKSYLMTALPTAESQVVCLRYILGQSVKEGLVSRPHLWPGVHAVRQLLTGATPTGEWFDGTGFGRRIDAQSRRKNPRPVRKADYFLTYSVELSPLPVWREYSAAERQRMVRHMVDEIECEGCAARQGRRPLGAKAIQQTPLDRRTELPPQPWFEMRRKMICWAHPKAEETQAYLCRYWAFQRAFRRASLAFRSGDMEATFPFGAFRPGTHLAAPS